MCRVLPLVRDESEHVRFQVCFTLGQWAEFLGNTFLDCHAQVS